MRTLRLVDTLRERTMCVMLSIAVVVSIVLFTPSFRPDPPRFRKVGITNTTYAAEVPVLCFSNPHLWTVRTEGSLERKVPFGVYEIMGEKGWTNAGRIAVPCGVGVGTIAFGRREFATFMVPPPRLHRTETYRFGIEYTQMGRSNIVWSEPLRAIPN